ncbi:MAG: endonuclease/exonuclease/phosphatase family protein [Candidatus Eisenbacteria sp.]|nr:endonuclease/exonuclease/phosphatase family protein [Candidatus Eisenbacteria bacterium]
MRYSDYPPFVVRDIARLRRRIEASGLPCKMIDSNLIVATWNLRAFGSVYEEWEENDDSPKRNLRGMACIAEVVKRFDVVAIQEVRTDTTAIRMLVDDFLGPDWGLIMSDVSAGDKGNSERLAAVYDKRRVQPSGLAGEIVLPPSDEGDPVEQFDRTPYIVGFQAGSERFSLLTAHIRYGDAPAHRVGELRALAAYTAEELHRGATADSEERNLIVLGDFNIDERGDNLLFQAFTETGLVVPAALRTVKSTTGSKPKHYDQIAWFMGDLDLVTTGRGGGIDFTGAVFQELTRRSMTYRVSDHFPLWVEFVSDRSTEQMANVLGVDPDMPNPLDVVPD